jgi:hypothetical protein
MKMKYLVFVLVLVLATSAFGLEKKAYQMRDDFGMEPQYDGMLNYYYYIPCPTYSWFWAYSGWDPGDIVGCGFDIGAQGTGTAPPLDPLNCNHIEYLRVLDFAGYGTAYPGLFTIEFDIWCAEGGPGALSLWNSGPVECGFAWNYFLVDPPVCVTECLGYCCADLEPIILVTATHVGTIGKYPAWGFDNISTSLEVACVMHDYGCLPAVWPRGPVTPGVCEGNVHSGYFGTYQWEFLPPISITDGRDTTEDGSQFGYIELAWRIYVICQGPTSTEPSTWGNIKSMYR